nr:endo-1,4-beta-xylanase 5-like [Ipomoea batatas]
MTCFLFFCLAKHGCWSFLKGGFELDSPSSYTLLYLQNSDGRDMNISVSSASLQPFTRDQWRANQQYIINTEARCDDTCIRFKGKEAASYKTLTLPLFYSQQEQDLMVFFKCQQWFIKRFNTAVFEDELKWYSTEPQPGKINYTIPEKMMDFVRANQISARGHNIFWENPIFIPSWVLNLTGPQLSAAVHSRIQTLMDNFKNEFIHWDVDNEMLHYNFYEKRLGPNASLEFFQTVQGADPLAKLFVNDYNVVESCNDMNSSVDAYIAKLSELQQGGVTMAGIGLEGHFTVPNPPLIRATLDKLATLNLPIWLTEVDISKTLDEQTQAKYLEVVLREGFSHPAVNGIMLWTALHPYGCYQMCLTDQNFRNLPAGDIVDELLKEWQTEKMEGQTDSHGSFSFYGFLGEYNLTVNYGNRTAKSTFSLCRGDETRHLYISLQN